jgi:hypothetical protein
MEAKRRVERAFETQDAALALIRTRGEWVVRGDISFRMVRGDLTLALRTPFQRLPKTAQPRERANLPCRLEDYAPQRVLDIAGGDAGLVELVGYDPGEWEWAIKAGEI